MALSDAEKEQLKREVEATMRQNQQQNFGPEQFIASDGSSISHVIGVVSGKGGVGKSMVSALLATELARAGHKVGILDADITGPSIPKMFGLSGEHLSAEDNLIVPSEVALGIKIVSTNLMLDNESDPVVWRGPVLASALEQFYTQTKWGELDYLICDMPPGTGDVALTIFQSIPIEGLVIVSSPQDLVQMVVGKAVNMAKMMHIPVLGLVENMSYMACPHCGEELEVFGPSRLEETAATYDIAALGKLPLDPALADAADKGAFADELPEGLLPDAISAVLSVASNGAAS